MWTRYAVCFACCVAEIVSLIAGAWMPLWAQFLWPALVMGWASIALHHERLSNRWRDLAGDWQELAGRWRETAKRSTRFLQDWEHSDRN